MARLEYFRTLKFSLLETYMAFKALKSLYGNYDWLHQIKITGLLHKNLSPVNLIGINGLWTFLGKLRKYLNNLGSKQLPGSFQILFHLENSAPMVVKSFINYLYSFSFSFILIKTISKIVFTPTAPMMLMAPSLIKLFTLLNCIMKYCHPQQNKYNMIKLNLGCWTLGKMLKLSLHWWIDAFCLLKAFFLTKVLWVVWEPLVF